MNRRKQGNENAFQYKLSANFSSVTSLQDLTDRTLEAYNYVILEIPSIINHSLPIELIRKADLSLLVVSADKTWNEADTHSLNRYKEIAQKPVLLLLNRMKADYLKSLIGRIPRLR